MNTRKPELQNIDAETQIFTPAYVAKYLAQNSIGRIWLASKPTSKVKDEFGWYVDSPQPEGIATVSSPEEIRVIDPACGTGNLLVAAFDVLYAIYKSERYKPAEIPALILRNNLVGRDIDPEAAGAACAILTARAHAYNDHFFRYGITPNVRAFTTEDDPQAGLFGTLVRHLDTDEYHVVLANPPYMGSKHFTNEMSAFAKAEYPDSRRDLCAMFIERGFEMLVPGGIEAMVTMEAWMFLSSFEQLRRRILQETTIVTMAHLGRGVFGSGAVISVTAFAVVKDPNPKYEGVYFRLVDEKHKQQMLHQQILSHRLGGFRQEMGDAKAYFTSEEYAEMCMLEREEKEAS